jgi:hypothetical protein
MKFAFGGVASKCGGRKQKGCTENGERKLREFHAILLWFNSPSKADYKCAWHLKKTRLIVRQ